MGMHINKPVIVLNLLLAEREVEIDGIVMAIREFNKVKKICTPATTSSGDKIFVPVDMPMDLFIKLCEAIPDDKLFLMTAGKALQDMAKDKRKKRSKK